MLRAGERIDTEKENIRGGARPRVRQKLAKRAANHPSSLADGPAHGPRWLPQVFSPRQHWDCARTHTAPIEAGDERPTSGGIACPRPPARQRGLPHFHLAASCRGEIAVTKMFNKSTTQHGSMPTRILVDAVVVASTIDACGGRGAGLFANKRPASSFSPWSQKSAPPPDQA